MDVSGLLNESIRLLKSDSPDAVKKRRQLRKVASKALSKVKNTYMPGKNLQKIGAIKDLHKVIDNCKECPVNRQKLNSKVFAGM